MPTLFVHDSDDQIVPIGNSAVRAAKLVRNSSVKIYPGAPHGLCTTLPDQGQRRHLSFLAD
nr:Non-heme chloroperoxidase [Paraburkholderia busanensis]